MREVNNKKEKVLKARASLAVRGHPSLLMCAGTAPAARPCRCAGRSARQHPRFLLTLSLVRHFRPRPPNARIMSAAQHLDGSRSHPLLRHSRPASTRPGTNAANRTRSRTFGTHICLAKRRRGVCNSFCAPSQFSANFPKLVTPMSLFLKK